MDTMTNDNIPLVDLGLQYRRVAKEVHEGFDRVMANTSFILGPEAEAFERAYAEYCGVKHCIGVGNGTDAIELALRSIDVGPGDEVIAPANTFVATGGAIVRSGASLVLVDCDDNGLIDASQLAGAITPRTKAIVPVHLYGQMAPMRAVLGAAGEIPVIEDAAQSQGAWQDGIRSGGYGRVGATSFYPGKNLGAFGDAGAVTTNDDEVAERIRRLRNHGGVRKYEHLEVGVNSRLDGLQGVVLQAKLAQLDAWNDERRAAAACYGDLLVDLPHVQIPQIASGNSHVWHLYVIRIHRRDAVLAALNEAGIGAGIHYPAPIHQLPAFASSGFGDGSFPVAEKLAGEILSLPIYPGITAQQQERVVSVLRAAL
jgi:dTDP-4-amino-4,6-dideoxygalactose transaminase